MYCHFLVLGSRKEDIKMTFKVQRRSALSKLKIDVENDSVAHKDIFDIESILPAKRPPLLLVTPSHNVR